MVDVGLIAIGFLGIALTFALWHLFSKNNSDVGVELRKEIREMGSEQMNALQALGQSQQEHLALSLIHISEPTRPY